MSSDLKPSPSKEKSGTTLESLPNELLLKVFKDVPFQTPSGDNSIRNLSLVNHRFGALLKKYETSEMKDTMKRFPFIESCFPREQPDEPRGYAWLSKSLRKWEIVNEILDTITETLDDPEQCLAKEQTSGVHAGLLLLYRVSSIGKLKHSLSLVESSLTL